MTNGTVRSVFLIHGWLSGTIFRPSHQIPLNPTYAVLSKIFLLNATNTIQRVKEKANMRCHLTNSTIVWTKITLKQLEQKQLIETINVFLKKLPKEKRILFIRRYWFMESVKELAKDYGISETGISMRLSRIRSELKSHLIKEGYYD